MCNNALLYCYSLQMWPFLAGCVKEEKGEIGQERTEEWTHNKESLKHWKVDKCLLTAPVVLISEGQTHSISATICSTKT